MSDFRFKASDLDDPTKVADEIDRFTPNNLKTSASADPDKDASNVTLFQVSDIMLGIPGLRSEKEVQGLIHQQIFGGAKKIFDVIDKIPFTDSLTDYIGEEFGLDSPSEQEGSDGSIVIEPYDGYIEAQRKSINKVSSLANAEIGYESPVDRMDKYSIGRDKTGPEPWAGTFLIWLFEKAGLDQGGLLVESIATTKSNYQQAGRFGSEPTLGSIALFSFGADGLANHAGLVTKVEGDRITTIEGDVSTSTGGNRTGGGTVALKVSAARSILGYCYPIYPRDVASSGDPSSLTPEQVRSGVWIRPVPTAITSGYGWRGDPFEGDRRFHRGYDFDGDTGDPIKAARDGIVVFSGYNDGGYGNLIRIDHGGGYETRYGHMSRLGSKQGDRVTAGETIGYVGTTGRSTGPHLHFEVRLNGEAIDPKNVGII